MTTSLNLPEKLVVFDLEWTAWEGSREREWSGPHEYREVFDIGAVLVQGTDLHIADTYRQLVTLKLTPVLPEYSQRLTGITQADIDKDGVPFSQAILAFDAFTQGCDLYNWGVGDPVAIAESCQYKRLANPFVGRVHDIRSIFWDAGIPAEHYMSSTITEYFGKKNDGTAHQGLDDALNIIEALKMLRSRLK